MAALTANSVVYTITGRSASPQKYDNSGKYKNIKIVFGDGASTYPTNGVPLSKLAQMGFPYSIGDVIFYDASSSDGYVYKWDSVHNTIRIYQSPAIAGLGPLTELTTSATPASTTLYIRVEGH